MVKLEERANRAQILIQSNMNALALEAAEAGKEEIENGADDNGKDDNGSKDRADAGKAESTDAADRLHDNHTTQHRKEYCKDRANIQQCQFVTVAVPQFSPISLS